MAESLVLIEHDRQQVKRSSLHAITLARQLGGEYELLVIGHVVNVAARVAESAKGDEVVVTSAVRDATAELSEVEFSRLRGKNFKGVGESIAVCKARLRQ